MYHRMGYASRIKKAKGITTFCLILFAITLGSFRYSLINLTANVTLKSPIHRIREVVKSGAKKTRKLFGDEVSLSEKLLAQLQKRKCAVKEIIMLCIVALEILMAFNSFSRDVKTCQKYKEDLKKAEVCRKAQHRLGLIEDDWLVKKIVTTTDQWCEQTNKNIIEGLSLSYENPTPNLGIIYALATIVEEAHAQIETAFHRDAIKGANVLRRVGKSVYKKCLLKSYAYENSLNNIVFTLALAREAFKASPSVNGMLITGFVREYMEVYMPEDIIILLVDFICIPRDFTPTRKRKDDLQQQVVKTSQLLDYIERYRRKNRQVSVISEFMSPANECSIDYIHAHTTFDGKNFAQRFHQIHFGNQDSVIYVYNYGCVRPADEKPFYTEGNVKKILSITRPSFRNAQ